MYNNAKRKLTRAYEDNSTTGEAADTPNAPATPTKAKKAAAGTRKRKASAVHSSPGAGNVVPAENPDQPATKRYKLVPALDDTMELGNVGDVKKEEIALNGKKVAKPRAPRVKKEAAGARTAASNSKSKTPGASRSAPSSTLTSPGYPPSGEPTTIPDEELAVVAAAMDALNHEEEVVGTTEMGLEEQVAKKEEVVPKEEDTH